MAVLVISLGISMLSIVLIMIDVMPATLRNAFVAFYGGIFGTFLGVTIITASMLVVLVSLVVEDFALTRYSPAVEAITITDRIGSDPFDYTRVQSGSVAVGVGDFVAFSLIAAHATVFFPIHVWIMSILLGLVGVLINVFILAPEEGIMPATPLPASMAVFPWVVHIIALSLVGG
jgi:hypothetical protein